MKWTDFRSAPPPGTVLCPAAELDRTLCLSISGDDGGFPVLLVRVADEIRGYVNACPHQYLPLNYRSEQLLSADGTGLICSAHGAMFDAATGAVRNGADCGLIAVPVTQDQDLLRIG